MKISVAFLILDYERGQSVMIAFSCHRERE